MSDTIVFEGPDGRLYEIPVADAARYAVPGSRVAELRARAGASAAAAPETPAGHFRPGDPLPPGVPPPPATASATTTIPTPGGTVVLNFFFAQPGATQTVASESAVEGHHMVLEHGIPTMHTDLMYGEYIDKHGASQIGWHAHGPHGNAQ